MFLVLFLIFSMFDRSDVLGQFMPLVGIDWSQTGVTHLFSAVKVCSMCFSGSYCNKWKQKIHFLCLNISTGKRISVDVFKCTSDFSGLNHKTVSS